MDRLPLNCLSIWGKIFWILCMLTGIVSIVFLCMLIALDRFEDINYVIVFVLAGAFSVLTAIIAYPLTYKGAQKYLKQMNATGLKGLMITAWVFYGIYILSFFAMVAMAAIGPGILPLWFICEVAWGIIGWLFMLIYQEQARTDLPMTYEESSTYNGGPPNPSIAIETRVNEELVPAALSNAQ